jgi:hypothetical protein
MRQYSDTDAYLITYGWGTSGSFISSLIYDFLFDPEDFIPFSEEGNSHERLVNCYNNWDAPQEYARHPNRRSMGFVYDHVSPIKSDIPLIMLDHNFPNFNDLFSIYPKCKVIAISFTPKDVPRIKGNTFYKILKYKGMATDFDKERYNNIRIEEKFMKILQVYFPHLMCFVK